MAQNNESTPLLGGISENHDDADLQTLDQEFDQILHGKSSAMFAKVNSDVETGSEDTNVSLESPVPEWTHREIFVTTLAVSGACLAIHNIVALPIEFAYYDIFTFFAVSIPIYSAYQEQKVTEAKVIMRRMVTYKEQINSIVEKNDQIKNDLMSMESSVSKLEKYREILKDAYAYENMAIEDLEESLLQKQKILQQSGANLANELIDNIIDILLMGDTDGNGILSDEEIDHVIGAIERIQGVDLKDDEIKEKIVKFGRNQEGIMKLVNDIFDDHANLQSLLETN